ncbi:hypothetical protein OAS83_02155 [Candidatus Pelagibacter sp.]|jgi:hypothetical protein|nr:hypothetical protein [Candidatus Pelagibacter sp.]
MVFGLFKNKEAAELAKPISEILILGSKILKSLPKNKLNRADIMYAFSNKKLFGDPYWQVANDVDLYIKSPHRSVSIYVQPELSGDLEIKSDFSKFKFGALGIADYKGFSAGMDYDETDLKVRLIDLSWISKKSSDKYTSKAKTLYNEISRNKEFKKIEID